MKKNLIIIFTILTLILSVTVCSAATLSPALDVISAQYDMVVSGHSGTALCFSEENFSSHSLYSHASITVTELPPVSEGTLMLGSTAVTEGQTISSSNLGLLRFVPVESCTESSFHFTSDRSYSTRCVIMLTDKGNSAPVASGSGLSAVTMSDISCQGILAGYDDDGDELLFEITEYPSCGLVTLSDNKKGVFTYTPYEGFEGEDSFSYRIRDTFGNYSDVCEVALTVNERNGDTDLADMDGHWAHSAAVQAVSAGTIDVISENGKMYFDPDEVMTREEYLVFIMKSLGAPELSPVKTVFSDDEDISVAASGYVGAAEKLGIIDGLLSDGEACFSPKSPVTVAEAAVMLNRILGAEVVTAEAENLGWAVKDISALKELGVIGGVNTDFDPLSHVTRAEAVHMLYVVQNIYS